MVHAILRTLIATATASPLAFAAAQAQSLHPQAPVKPASIMVSAPSTPAKPSARTPRATPRSCYAPTSLIEVESALPRTTRKLIMRQPVTIVAIGSSSTAGTGASSRLMTYPSRLQALLQENFPDVTIRVLNRGIGGQETPQMIARFDQSVIAEKPDLVIWQLGTNAVLRDRDPTPSTGLIREGLAKLKAIGTDVVLLDPQFAPKVLDKPDSSEMVRLINEAAHENKVGLFRRFAVMRYWHDTVGITFREFLSPDGLHMNDWSYDCVARLLTAHIVAAVDRSTQMPVQATRQPAARTTTSQLSALPK